MQWREFPVRSGFIGATIIGLQGFSFWVVKRAAESKSEWEEWKRDLQVAIIADDDDNDEKEAQDEGV